MERLVTVKDVAGRYGVTLQTARKYIRQMFHYEAPLAAPRWAFEEWERNRETMPEGISASRKADILNQRERAIVPRKRG